MGRSDPPTKFIRRGARRSDGRLVPTLTVVEGPQIGAFFAFDPGRHAHRIGRAEDADVLLNDPSVSRTHAICIVAALDDRQTVRIEDNDSTNGVMLNGRTIRQSALISGDKVRLGDILLRFEWLAEEEVRYHSDVSEKIRAAERDALTGLLTRAFLDERLERLFDEADRRGQVLSCMLLDLDHFKAINDVHGHLVGDGVIRRVARTLQDALRETDYPVRYGGEEFLVIMPGLEVADAEQVALRLRERLAGTSMHDLSPGLQVTTSIGVAARGRGEAAPSWIERADRALYSAKHEGRDQVFVADPPPPAPPPPPTSCEAAGPPTDPGAPGSLPVSTVEIEDDDLVTQDRLEPA